MNEPTPASSPTSVVSRGHSGGKHQGVRRLLYAAKEGSPVAEGQSTSWITPARARVRRTVDSTDGDQTVTPGQAWEESEDGQCPYVPAVAGSCDERGPPQGGPQDGDRGPVHPGGEPSRHRPPGRPVAGGSLQDGTARATGPDVCQAAAEPAAGPGRREDAGHHGGRRYGNRLATTPWITCAKSPPTRSSPVTSPRSP